MTVPDGYKIINGRMWPATDTQCHPVANQVTDSLAAVYKHCRDFRVAVQAGGCVGIWPDNLKDRFELVYTFEPDPENFRCLCHNAPSERVLKFNAALGAWRGCVDMERRPGNIGAHQMGEAGTGSIPTLRIDDLGLARCDLIYLDVEGAEWLALQGARHTIQERRPTVVVEDKGLSVKYGMAKDTIVDWMAQEFGYRVAARYQRDVIMVPA